MYDKNDRSEQGDQTYDWSDQRIYYGIEVAKTYRNKKPIIIIVIVLVCLIGAAAAVYTYITSNRDKAYYQELYKDLKPVEEGFEFEDNIIRTKYFALYVDDSKWEKTNGSSDLIFFDSKSGDESFSISLDEDGGQTPEEYAKYYTETSNNDPYLDNTTANYVGKADFNGYTAYKIDVRYENSNGPAKSSRVFILEGHSGSIIKVSCNAEESEMDKVQSRFDKLFKGFLLSDNDGNFI